MTYDCSLSETMVDYSFLSSRIERKHSIDRGCSIKTSAVKSSNTHIHCMSKVMTSALTLPRTVFYLRTYDRDGKLFDPKRT